MLTAANKLALAVKAPAAGDASRVQRRGARSAVHGGRCTCARCARPLGARRCMLVRAAGQNGAVADKAASGSDNGSGNGKPSMPLWQQVHRKPGAEVPQAAAPAPVEEPSAPAVPDVAQGAAPLWASVHAKKDDSSMWQRVNASRENASLPAAPAAAAAPAEPQQANPAAAPAPAWQNVHMKKAEEKQPWWKIQLGGVRDDSTVVAQAVPQKEAPAAPSPDTVQKAPPPLWAAVHQGRGKQGPPSTMWQKVNNSRTAAPEEEAPPAAAAASAPAAPATPSVAKGAAPLWSSVHQSTPKQKEDSMWSQVNASREGVSEASVATPVPSKETPAPKGKVSKDAGKPLWMAVHHIKREGKHEDEPVAVSEVAPDESVVYTFSDGKLLMERRSNSTMSVSNIMNTFMLLGGDILALMAFIALAPVSLGELAATPEMLFTAAAPLVAGWIVAAYCVGGYGPAAKGRNITKAVWCAVQSWALGITTGILVGCFLQGHTPTKDLLAVTYALTGALLVGWRFALAVMTRLFVRP